MKPKIDHFYLILTNAKFKQLKKLAQVNPEIVHKEVKSGNETWEGIYIPSKSGLYLELLKPDSTHPPGAMGLAFSALGKEKNTKKFLEEISLGEKWEEVTKKDKNNKPWFKAYLYPDPARLWILPWFMHYNGVPRKERPTRFSKASIKNFPTIEMTVTASRFKHFEEQLWWCPLSTVYQKNKITIISGDTQLIIRKGLKQHFKSIWQLTKSHRWKSLKTADATFKVSNSRADLSIS
ncbi:MAG: hypothetical protein HN509_15520 [Halobacteriovoraceae bacterium]|nr:hypothetical protein [Halobacteriovoraceae bacterium]MBT5092967.1 hypothetical protein [Halobacteriovoraceae bacterium]